MRDRSPASGNTLMRSAECGVRNETPSPPVVFIPHSAFRIPHLNGGSHGVALITTVILLLMLGSLGSALVVMVHSRLTSMMLEVDRLQAAYLAEAGLARAVYEISKDRDTFGADGIGTIPPTPLGPGYFWVQKFPESRTLVGTGIVRDVRRVIVNRY